MRAASKGPSIPGRLVRGLILACLLSSSASGARPRVYAIVGARIVAAPGRTLASGTVVIRNGTIMASDLAKPLRRDLLVGARTAPATARPSAGCWGDVSW